MRVLNLADLVRGTKSEVFRTTDAGLMPGVASPADLSKQLGPCFADSRRAAHSGVFFALPGTRVDGHTFVPRVLTQGAVGAVVTRLTFDEPLPANRHLFLTKDPLRALQSLATYWRGLHDLLVIGVTGSIGKTTVKEAIAQTLSPLVAGSVLESTGNLNTEIGLPLELTKLNRRHRVAVLEMGMYARGDIALLAGIAKPRMGVVTNVLPVHLKRTGSLLATAQAKAELIHALPPDGLSILNGDDAYALAMRASSRAPTEVYGSSYRHDFVVSNIQGLGRNGFEANFSHGPRCMHVHCPTPGEHNALNLLPAIAVAHHVGIDWSAIEDALQRFHLIGRATFVPGLNSSTLLDDRYNASADSVVAALTLLQQEPGRHLAILGEMHELGAEEEAQHRAVGRSAASLDHLILLGPKTEWIADEAQRAGLPRDRIVRVQDNEQAADAARTMLEPGDVLLVKGARGLHLEDVVDSLRNEAPLTAK